MRPGVRLAFSGRALADGLIACLGMVFVAGASLALDLTCKQWATEHQHARVELLPGVLSTTFTTNTGATFGLFGGRAQILAVVSVVILGAVLVLWWLEARQSLVASLAVGLIAGGALGNLRDRLLLGYVVDFLHLDILPWWPAFNIADVATVVGVLVMAVWLAWPRRKACERQREL